MKYRQSIMMNQDKNKLTLDCPATYQIRVPGELDQSLTGWSGSMQISLETGEAGPISVLTATVDQAALHGLLRRLYSLGLPLISVAWMKRDPGEQQTK